MVSIDAGARNRLIAAASRCFGLDGEVLVETVTRQSFNRPLDEMSYAELPGLLDAVDRAARIQMGNETAAALAAALLQLQEDIDAGFGGRLAGVLTSRVGAATEPLLNGACARLGVSLDALEPSRLPEVAVAIHTAASTLFGAEAAADLRTALLGVASARPAGLTPQILALTREQLGENGDAILDRLCREHLEIALDDLDAGNVRLLALAVERHGPALFGASLATTFVADASAGLRNPAGPLRHTIVELTRSVIGPFAPEFLDEVCSEHGLPFQAVDEGHLDWLAEVLRAEAEPLAGKEAADGLARELRALSTATR